MSTDTVTAILWQAGDATFTVVQVILAFVVLVTLSLLLGWVLDTTLWPAGLKKAEMTPYAPVTTLSVGGYILALVFKIVEQVESGWPLPLYGVLLWGLACVTFTWFWLLLVVATIRGTWEGYTMVKRWMARRGGENPTSTNPADESHELEEGLLGSGNRKDSTEC
ncbi:hypothetical protein PRZ48_007174 [Zasmidium cellare]|uniref:Uncharacterized protein n=1 Tax=Zasmidium cellare TaxID=395010 RepID=A0ABR0EJF1_ZASCE|nr:hypothetical protein PRZ48_007174 [Zasmidium cellare]